MKKSALLFLFLLLVFRLSAARILCSVYPVYCLAKAVTEGCTSLEVSLMVSASAGCPHDYLMTPQEMQKLTSCDVLIINGLSFEEFLEDALKKLPGKKIINASEGMNELISYCSDCSAEHHHHHDQQFNPHIFASPKRAGQMVMKIASELGRIFPEFSEKTLSNCVRVSSALYKLHYEMSRVIKEFPVRNIITQHDGFAYFAADLGLTVTDVIMEHAGHSPSAARMIELVRIIKEKGVSAVFTEPQFPDDTAAVIAKEASVPVFELDPFASGIEPADSNHYENVMRKNLEILKKALGKNG